MSGKTGNLGQCNYAASKSGVVGFTKTAAQELAKFNIRSAGNLSVKNVAPLTISASFLLYVCLHRCNSIMPGFIDTPMVETVPEKVMEQVLSKIPMRRRGTPDEVAEVRAKKSATRSR